MKKNAPPRGSRTVIESRARLLAAPAALLMGFLLSLAVTGPLHAQEGPTIIFTKNFQPATIGPGSTSTLTFVISNGDPINPALELAFSDTLPAGVVISSFPNARSSCGGVVTAPSGGTTITFTGGVVPASSECSISVDVSSATVGTHINVSGVLTSNVGSHGTASADLSVVTDRPGFSKFFTAFDVLFGERVTLVFTLDNTANVEQVENMFFVDELPNGMVVASPSNASTDCPSLFDALDAQPGSSVILYDGFAGQASLPAAEFCTISVDVVVQAVGLLGNVSGPLTSTVGLVELNSGHASARVNGLAHPVHLVKEFMDDPVPPGDVVTLEFTLMNFSRTESATDIGFSDDLDATLSGLEAVGLPLSVCNGGSLSGTGVVSLAGASLGPEESCTFSVDLLVPAGAASGAYPNETSLVSATVGGMRGAVRTLPAYGARDVLFVSPSPVITKTWTSDPVGAGGTATLEFTITNASDVFELTSIEFSDDFDVIMHTASMVPADGSCGPGSTFLFTPNTFISGSGGNPARLSMSDGSLAAGASCTFSIDLDVLPTAPKGRFDNATSTVTGLVNAEPVVGPPAGDALDVVAGPQLYKRFVDDPVAAGGTGLLEFTVSNDSNGQVDGDGYDNFTNVSFTDDLDAALTGLEAVGLPQNDVCGPGSTVSGTDIVTLSGASVSQATACTFQVGFQVPAGAIPGPYTNITSEVNATAAGLNVSGNAASDVLRVAGLALSKSFTDDPAAAGGTVTLEFTMQNLTSDLQATGILFFDDLDNNLNGLAATGLPQNDICGAGSQLSGSDGNTFLTFSNGTLDPLTSCTFSVILQVPAPATSGIYPNTTSSFSAVMGGLRSAFEDAVDDLAIAGEGTTTVRVNKAYTENHPLGDPEVLVTLICDNGNVEPNGGIDVETVGGVATFMVSGFPGGKGITCSATETEPPGYVEIANDCDAIAVEPDVDPGPECTITNRPTEALFTVDKEFSDSNPVLGVMINTPVCIDEGGGPGITYDPPGGGNASLNTDFVTTVKYFNGTTNCTATEADPVGYTMVPASSTCDDANRGISDAVDGDCLIFNQQDPVTILAFKEYIGGMGPSVTFAAECGGEGTLSVINPNASPGVPAEFLLSNFPWDGATCNVTEPAPPAGYNEVGSTCNNLLVVPSDDDTECTITNAETRVAFQVTKDFSDDNPAEVEVTIQCNTGLPLQQTTLIAEGDGVTFVVGDFISGTMDCEVFESVPPGYQPSYMASGQSASGAGDDGCFFTAVDGGDQNLCEITNTLLPVDVTVNKEWIDENPGFQSPLWVSITLRCDNGSIVNGYVCGGDSCIEAVIDPGNPGVFLVFPDWDGTTSCSVTEEPLVGVLQDVDDCAAILLAPGQGGECTIVNTRLYAGIPVLSPYGLALLALLMLGLGLVGFRRFA